MTMPSPFEIGRNIGGQVATGLRERRELSAIDQILEEASNDNDPNARNRAIGNILRNISPEKQPAALTFLKQKDDEIAARKMQNAQINLANEIEKSYPGSKNHQLIANIWRSDIPPAEKEKMIKSITGGHNLTGAQRESAHLDRVQRRYRNQINDLKKDYKEARLADRKPIEDEIKRLQSELKLLLNFSNAEESFEEKSAVDKEQKFAQEKPVFDENNSAHMKRVEELEKEYGEDVDKIEAALQKEFRE